MNFHCKFPAYSLVLTPYISERSSFHRNKCYLVKWESNTILVMTLLRFKRHQQLNTKFNKAASLDLFLDKSPLHISLAFGIIQKKISSLGQYRGRYNPPPPGTKQLFATDWSPRFSNAIYLSTCHSYMWHISLFSDRNNNMSTCLNVI